MKTSIYSLTVLAAVSVLHGAVIATQDFDSATDWEPSYNPAIGSFTSTNDTWDVVTSLSTLSVGDENFLGARDVKNDNNKSGKVTLTLLGIDTSAHGNISISFDYETIKFDASDNVVYAVVIDDVEQTTVPLMAGDGVSNVMSTKTIMIAGTPSKVGLKVTITQDGGSDYAGLDNFVLEGDLIAVPEPSTALLSGLALLGLVRRKR